MLTAALLFASTDEDELSVSVAIDLLWCSIGFSGGNLHPKTKKSPFPGWERGWNEDLSFGPLLIFPMRAGIGTGPNFHLFNVGPVVVASKGQIPQPLSMRLRVT